MRNTKQILEKIDEVNRVQNLKKAQKDNYDAMINDPHEARMIPEEPFKNPILEYLLHANNRSPEGIITKTVPTSDVDAEDDNIPGRSVTRKITHHQTLIFPTFDPMDNFLPYEMQYPLQNPQNFSRIELENQTIQNIKNIVQTSQQQPPPRNDMYNYSPYYPYVINLPNYPALDRPAKQWTPPLQNIFPIIIKNPFQTMFNAFTSLVEYGPEADVCKHTRDGRILKIDQKNEERNENSLQQQNPNEGIVIENIEVTDDEESTQSSENGLRNEKGIRDKSKKKRPLRPTRPPQIEEEVIMNQKGLFTSDNNKRQVNRQNIGGGIFIQKLRVRKGGVAIAGPGGIATAGTGGTAIVGPNGYAYTHPDSLAIAGTGTKVIAVDPSIDLTKIVDESSSRSKTKNDTNVSRFGKIVAVGPVVYYNQG